MCAGANAVPTDGRTGNGESTGHRRSRGEGALDIRRREPLPLRTCADANRAARFSVNSGTDPSAGTSVLVMFHPVERLSRPFGASCGRTLIRDSSRNDKEIPRRCRCTSPHETPLAVRLLQPEAVPLGPVRSRPRAVPSAEVTPPPMSPTSRCRSHGRPTPTPPRRG
jgi:hypothetical protein